MEDKELQELFEAKRTVEANRRRQEELRKLMAASAAPKSRRLWPVWIASAAASVAVLLITLPLLFRNETAEPLLVAEAKRPVAVEPTKQDEPQPQKTLETLEALETLGTLKTIESPEPATEIAAAEEPALIAEPEPMVVEEPEDPLFAEAPLPATDTPTIHRRTSTRLANSGNIVTVQTEPSGFQNLLASVFASETSTPVTLKTIEF